MVKKISLPSGQETKYISVIKDAGLNTGIHLDSATLNTKFESPEHNAPAGHFVQDR